MEKLATLTHITKQVLIEVPETRGDDGELVVNVFERLGISPWHSLKYMVSEGHFNLIRSIIRFRCKIQQECVELCNPVSEARRQKRESAYRAYARSHLSEILSYNKGENK